MTKEYKYRPPFKYLIAGLAGLLASLIFGLAIGKDQIWFSPIVGLFCLVTLAIGVGFLTIYIRKYNVENLKLGDNYIEIPGRWKDKMRLNFSEILNIKEFNTFDNVIEIESKEGVHLIERNWMKQKDFDNLKKTLQDCLNKI